jgi:hypothetical protein
MTDYDRTSTRRGTAAPIHARTGETGHGGWALLWFGLALIVAALMLAAVGDGEHRLPGPPTVTVGTAVLAAHHGDAA